MTAREKFIKIIQAEIFDRPDIWSENYEDDWEDVVSFWEDFKNGTVKNSRIITEKGIVILRYLQSKSDNYIFSAKMLAEALDLNTRSISGTLKKLVNDGYVNKVTTISPITYEISEAGISFNLDEFENK